MRPGEEWLTARKLKVKKIAETKPDSKEQLSIEDEMILQRKLNRK